MWSIFSKQGGSIAEPGAVAWQFERKGLIMVPGSVDEDDVMLAAIDAGADDVSGDGEHWQVTTEAQLTAAVRQGIEDAGIAVEASDLTMLPSSVVELDTAEAAKAVLRLVDALEDHDDVQHVYANMDISDDVLAAIDA